MKRWIWALLLVVAATGAWAADPADDLSYERRRWTQEDGAPGQSGSIAQASDGMMWFASPNGLYSFDGIRFQRHTKLYGEKLLSPSVNTITALPDGGMAVGYLFGGMSIFTPKGSKHYIAGKNYPLGTTQNFATAPDGKLYALTTTSFVALNNGVWERVGNGNMASVSARTVRFDAEGTLWVLNDREFFARRKGEQQFTSVMQFEKHEIISFFNNWLHIKLPAGNFIKLRGSGQIEPLKVENSASYDRINNGPNDTIIGSRDGGMARMGKRDDGTLYEIEFYPPADSAGNKHGSGGWGISTSLDREGNYWRTTYEGVEKTRLHRFHQIKLAAENWLVRPGLGDELLLGAMRRPLIRQGSDGKRETTEVFSPTAMLRVASDQVWVGTNKGLWELRPDAGARLWPFPEDMQSGADIQAIALDRDDKLLVSVGRKGLLQFDQGVWSPDPRLKGMTDPTPITMLRTASGQTWIGLTNSRLGTLTPDGFKLLPPGSNFQLGNTLSLLDVDGHLLAGGDMGLAWIDGERVHPMTFKRSGNVLRVTGMVRDKLGQLWIHCNDGLLVVSPESLAQFWRAPGQALVTEQFDFQDGVIGTAPIFRPLPTLSLDGKGRVYYATSSQAGWIDPAEIRRNPRAPDVIIESLHTAEGSLPPADGMVLPGHPTAVNIAFTTSALAIPERVRLKYKLDGVDADWQEVQRERMAHYTNLAPGTYYFKVIAANEDGVWNLQGALLRFEILPWFWQTTWFRLLCALLLLLAAVLAYRWRISAIKRHADVLAEERAAARIEATLYERSRIARSLHDNLLQAVQALILRFHSLQSRMPQEPELQSGLNKVLDYAEELVASTRDEVMALRRDTSCEELFAKLKQSLASTMPEAQDLLTCSVVGEPSPLQGDVVNEMFYVLREAVWNSARHARASQIAVTLRFDAQQFEGSVIDDGVGIDDAVAEHGAEGHWGLVGMRERIERLGGKMLMTAGAKAGVTLRFVIPGPLAYQP